MDKIINILTELRDILDLNGRSSLSAKVAHLIELRSKGDESFVEKFNSGYFWGASYPDESAPVWGVNCQQRTKDYLQAFVQLAQAMREEGISHARSDGIAEQYRKLLDRNG